jgi:predicted nicotinamide N-methyase
MQRRHVVLADGIWNNKNDGSKGRHRRWKSKTGTYEGAELFGLLEGFDGLHSQLISAESHKTLELRYTFNRREIMISQLTKEQCEQNLGGKVWDCAVVLLRCYLEQGGEELQGKTVLELGSGLGLTGIACVIAGAAHTVLTDAYTAAVLTKNVAANLTPEECGRVDVKELVWGSTSSEENILTQNFKGRAPDIIVASDVLYSTAVAPALIETLQHMCGVQTRVIIAYKHRHACEAQVWATLEAVFELSQLQSPELDAIGRLCHVGLFELRPRLHGEGSES